MMRRMFYESRLHFGRRGRYQTATFVPYMDCVSRDLHVFSSRRAILAKSAVVVSLDGSRRPIAIDNSESATESGSFAVALSAGSSLQVIFERRDRRFTVPIVIGLSVEAIQHEPPLRVDPQWGNGGSDGPLSH